MGGCVRATGSCNRLASETIVDDAGITNAITRSYATSNFVGRNTGFSLDSDYSVSYTFGDLGRFAGISAEMAGLSTNSWVYGYLADSDMISTISNSVLEVTKSYEATRNLITQIQNKTNGIVLSQYGYGNDSLGRRTNRIDTLASYASPLTNAFTYNTRSELTNAVMDTNTFGYAFDNIGNRLTSSSNSADLTYLANQLNQYTNIANDATNDLLYDLDGNLTNDGVRAYSWNCENRLITVAPLSPASGDKKIDLAYDYMGRRFEKVVYTRSSTNWVSPTTNTFIYQGWNLIAESTTNATNHYVWGLDLSGSLRGAGGVGGLVAVTTADGTYLPAFDGNGNVCQYIDATNGTVVAHREYSAFGETITSTGSKKNDFAHWFSTKRLDAETGLCYYGYRYYDPETGRWTSREPLGDRAFFDHYTMGLSRDEVTWYRKQSRGPLYVAMANTAIGTYDKDGATTPVPGNWRATWRNRYDQLRRRPNEYSPIRACEQANADTGRSISCSSFGFRREPTCTFRASRVVLAWPNPVIYCGCSYAPLQQTCGWLRGTGDAIRQIGASGQITQQWVGGDKLAHCYGFCVGVYWWYTPGLTYLGVRGMMQDDDANDRAANVAGFRLGRRKKLLLGNVRDCLKDCAQATRNLPFSI